MTQSLDSCTPHSLQCILHSCSDAVHLQLPGELDVVADVQVDLEVQQVPHALVVEGVQALDHQDLRTAQGARPVSKVLRGCHRIWPRVGHHPALQQATKENQLSCYIPALRAALGALSRLRCPSSATLFS